MINLIKSYLRGKVIFNYIILNLLIIITGLFNLEIFHINKFSIQESEMHLTRYIEEINNIAESYGYEVSKTYTYEETSEIIGVYKIKIDKNEYIMVKMENYKGQEEFYIEYVRKVENKEKEFEYLLYTDICNCVFGRKIYKNDIKNIIKRSDKWDYSSDKQQDISVSLSFEEDWVVDYYYDYKAKEEKLVLSGLTKDAVPKEYDGINYWVIMFYN